MNHPQEIYTIRVSGQLDPEWSQMLNGLEILTSEEDGGSTVLVGPVRDQSALRGILNKLWDLNLSVLSVMRDEKSNHLEANLPRSVGGLR